MNISGCRLSPFYSFLKIHVDISHVYKDSTSSIYPNVERVFKYKIISFQSLTFNLFKTSPNILLFNMFTYIWSYENIQEAFMQKKTIFPHNLYIYSLTRFIILRQIYRRIRDLYILCFTFIIQDVKKLQTLRDYHDKVNYAANND